MRDGHAYPFSLLVFLLLCTVLLGAGCGPKIYTNPEFAAAKDRHHIVAILPFEVSIGDGKATKNMTEETLEKLEKDEAYQFQQVLYSEFLERQEKKQYSIKFLDVEETNTLLNRAEISYEKLGNYTKRELGAILGVDALITGSINRTQPMSATSAIVVGVLFGYMGSTNKVSVTANIYDAALGELMWKYNHEASGTVGSSSEGLAKSLMKGISKKFPYKIKE